jgi:ligand-binding SRPBCC domain-containing protein
MAKSHQLRRTQIIPRPRDEIFAFFSDASNLERITPAFVGFEILTRGPLAIQAGARIARSLEKIFDHRTEQIGAIFGSDTNERS